MKLNVPNKEINRLAVPAIISGLIEPIISLTDISLISHNFDSKTIAGVGIGAYTIMLFIWVFSSLKNSTSSIVAQYFGEENKKRIDVIGSNALILSLAIGVLIVIFSNIFAPFLFKIQNASGETLSIGIEYFQIRSLAIPFMLSTLVLFGVFKGYQNTSWAMKITLTGGIINIVLDLLLINGVGIIPGLGVKGVALASLISQVIMFIMSIYYFRNHFAFSFSSNQFFSSDTGRLTIMSLDLLLRTIALNLVFILSNRFVMRYGPEHMAAHSILFWMWLLQSYFIDGFSNAGMALAGKIKGQKRYGLLYRLGMKICKTNILLSVLLGAILLFVYPFINILSEDVNVVRVLRSTYFIMIASFPISALAFTFDGIYIGIGKVQFLRNLLIISSLAIFIPSLYIADHFEMATIGAWLSLLAWLFARGIIPLLHFQNRYQSFNKL